MSHRASISALTLLGLLALAGCGGGDDPGPPPASDGSGQEVTGEADPADVKVIEAWSDALREGDIDAAASYFAIPSVVENGVLLRIRNRDDARLFNLSLPCGAILVDAQTEGDFTTATFELSERPGPGTCGQGSQSTAETAFVISDGKIAEWRRVAVGGAEPAPGEAA
ncbi:MAG: nuclear transport factor 2 family protein [bacterium]